MFPKKGGRKGLISGAVFPLIPAGKGPGGGKISSAMSHTDASTPASDAQANNGPGYSQSSSNNTGVGGMRGHSGQIMSVQEAVRKGTGKRTEADNGIRRSVHTPRQEGNVSAGASRTQTAQARVRDGKGRPASDGDVSVGPKIRGNTMKPGQASRAEKARKAAATGNQIPDSMEEGMGGVIRAAKGGHVKAAFGGMGGRPMGGARSYPAPRPPMARPPMARPPMGRPAPAPGAMGMSPGMPRPAGGFRPAMARGGHVPGGMSQFAKMDAKLDKKLGDDKRPGMGRRRSESGR